MQSGFPPHPQWEDRASLGVILLEESSTELPQGPALQSPTGDPHTSGKCTKPISSGFPFQLKQPASMALSSSSPASFSSMALVCGVGATVALVLLAFIGAVVCIRISKLTVYTVCTWCEEINHFHAYFSLFFPPCCTLGENKYWYLSRFKCKQLRVNQLQLLASVRCCK